jgi:nicotinamidase-related amidase
MRLLERADCLLVVIDVQERFYPDPAPAELAALAAVAARCGWLAGVAVALDVPVVVTEEDPARNGRTVAGIRAALAPGTPVLTKPVFGLAEVPEILAAVDATGRRTAVLAGLETDVCVAHSALGLLDRGYRVAAVSDAVYAPAAVHAHGIARLRDAGVELVHAKGLYYEWVRTLEAARAFEDAHPELAAPPGFSL